VLDARPRLLARSRAADGTLGGTARAGDFSRRAARSTPLARARFSNRWGGDYPSLLWRRVGRPRPHLEKPPERLKRAERRLFLSICTKRFGGPAPRNGAARAAAGHPASSEDSGPAACEPATSFEAVPVPEQLGVGMTGIGTTNDSPSEGGRRKLPRRGTTGLLGRIQIEARQLGGRGPARDWRWLRLSGFPDIPLARGPGKDTWEGWYSAPVLNTHEPRGAPQPGRAVSPLEQ